MNSLPILAAEDEETDRFMLGLAFERSKLLWPLVTVSDGQECVDYLSGAGAFADRARHPLPCLLLLDLKMPRMDGFEVLAWIATRPELKEMRVLVFSSSAHEVDIQRARQLGAHDYIVKPHTLSELGKLLTQLSEHWLTGP
jgi:CheY-like chemotaxis protein